MPDSIRFLLILACLGGAVYGGMFYLSEFPPPQQEIVKQVPSGRFASQ